MEYNHLNLDTYDDFSDPGTVVLTSGNALAELSPTGAEPRAWRCDGQPILWNPRPEFWPGVAPILFPVCGATQDDTVRHGGRTAPMPLHGFAKDTRFTLSSRRTDSATLTLSDSSATHSAFPYAFRLKVRYDLTEDSLTQTFTLENTGEAAMPYSLGVHPGFDLPADTGNISFEQNERPEIAVLEGRYFTDRTRPSPVRNRRLALTPDTFRDGSICILNAASRALTLHRPDGHGVTVRLDGFPHLILWAVPGGEFVAIEGWTGHGDPVIFTGSFGERPSTSWLQVGGRATYSAAFTAF